MNVRIARKIYYRALNGEKKPHYNGKQLIKATRITRRVDIRRSPFLRQLLDQNKPGLAHAIDAINPHLPKYIKNIIING